MRVLMARVEIIIIIFNIHYYHYNICVIIIIGVYYYIFIIFFFSVRLSQFTFYDHVGLHQLQCIQL